MSNTRLVYSTGAGRVCPECGRATKRLFTPVGVQFKGSGFHNTDYKPRPKESEGCSAKSDSPKCAGCPAAES